MKKSFKPDYYFTPVYDYSGVSDTLVPQPLPTKMDAILKCVFFKWSVNVSLLSNNCPQPLPLS
jgi:hypothetical protein